MHRDGASRNRTILCSSLLVLTCASGAHAQDVAERANKVYQIFKRQLHRVPRRRRAEGRARPAHARASLLKGGQSGDVVVPHQPDKSMLYLLVTHAEDPPMPRKKPKLGDDGLELIRQWIEDGGSLEGRRRCGPGHATSAEALAESRGAADHGRRAAVLGVPAPVRALAAVASTRPRWQRNPIDAFLLSEMTAKRPEAGAEGRSAHARPPRLSRPARPAADAGARSTRSSTITSPDAWPKLVDTLLASPHYGERWARHWLDLVRYADSGGFEFDVDRPEGLALPRLRRQRVQQRQAVRAVRPRAARRRRDRRRRSSATRR